MTLRSSLAFSVLLACTPAHAGPGEDALAAYGQFFDAFTTGNHDRVAGMFAPDALFYGTRSVELATTPEAIRQYFVEALSGARGEVRATRFGETLRVLADDVVAVSGKWQSERTAEGKMHTAGPSRVTVVLQRRNGRWLIVQFHNSPTPRPAS